MLKVNFSFTKECFLLITAIQSLVFCSNSLYCQIQQIEKPTISINSLKSAVTLISDKSIKLEYSFDSPVLTNGHLNKSVRSPKGLDKINTFGIELCSFIREISCESSNISIESLESYEIPCIDEIIFDKQIINNNGYLNDWVNLSYAGIMGNLPVSSVIIHPYRYLPNKKSILYAKKIVLKIDSKIEIDKKFFANPEFGNESEYFINKNNRFSAKLQSNSIRKNVAPDGYEYKFSINKDNIYRVTALDLKNLGIPISDLKTNSLKLYNDNIELPIYIDDKGDGVLNVETNDFIEFFGEQYRPKFQGLSSDIKTSNYTKFNVYFFTWGGAKGLRIIDENAEVRTRPSVDSGRTLTIVDLGQAQSSFTSFLHFEINNEKANKFPNSNINSYSDDNDRIMWTKIEKGTQFIFDSLILPSPDQFGDDLIKIILSLRGTSIEGERRDQPPRMLHKVETFIGTPEYTSKILDAKFKGDQPFISSSDTNKSFVNNAIKQPTSRILNPDGKSRIGIVNQPIDTASIEAFYLNWFDIGYQRKYYAWHDSLTFTTPRESGSKYYNFTIRKFTKPDIRIYRKGISRLINLSIRNEPTLSDTSANTFEAYFQAYSSTDKEQFYAITEKSIPKPIMQKDTSRYLKNSENDFNYVIIVDDSTSDYININNPNHPLNIFADYKKTNQKFNVNVVRATDIYDEFNGGVVSPEAIQRFTEYAYENWKTPLKYVLIASCGEPLTPQYIKDLDLRTFYEEHNYVPSISYQTLEFGATTCDYLYGCIKGKTVISQGSVGIYSPRKYSLINDFVAEVYFSRISVGSIIGIKNYIEKFISQEKTQNKELWRGRSVFVVGSDEKKKSIFEKNVTQILDLGEADNFSEPVRFFTDSVKRSSRFIPGSNFMDFLNKESASIVSYLGHGGGGQWEDANYFTPKRVSELTNANKMPAVLSFSCFTGNYTPNPEQGMMTALMTQSKTGALNGLGAAGYSFRDNNAYLAIALFSVLNNPSYRNLPFAQVVSIAKARYFAAYRGQQYDSTFIPSVICAMYSIFGDPSHPLDHAQDILDLYPTKQIVNQGEEISAIVNFPFLPSNIYVSLFDTTEINLPETFSLTTSNSKNFTAKGIVPSGYQGRYIGIRVYAYDESGRTATGTIRYGINTPNLISIKPNGELRAGVPIQFDVKATGDNKFLGLGVLIVNSKNRMILDQVNNLNQISVGLWRSDPIPANYIQNGLIIAVTPKVLGSSTQSEKFFVVSGGADPSAIALTPEDRTREKYTQPDELKFGAIVNETIGYSSTIRGGKLSFYFYNWGDLDMKNGLINVKIKSSLPGNGVSQNLLYSNLLTDTLIYTGKISIPARDSIKVELPNLLNLPPLERVVQVSFIPESDTIYNNTYSTNDSAFNLVDICGMGFIQNLGYSTDGILPTKFSFQNIGNLIIPQNNIKINGVTTISIFKDLPITQQKWRFLKVGTDAINTQALRIITKNESDNNTEGIITLSVYKADTSFYNSRIVRYDSVTKLWLGYETTRSISEGTISAKIPLNGIFAVATEWDSKGPLVKFNIDGQAYIKGTPIPSSPNIGILVTDPSGINTNPGTLKVTIDGKQLNFNQDFVYLDSTITPVSSNIKLEPKFTEGNHNVCIEVQDRLGNITNVCETFEVNEEVKLVMLGTFPNPFNRELFFGYELQGSTPASTVELKLFTTSGRLIKTFNYPNETPVSGITGFYKGGTGLPTSLGYHEIWWNGRDEDGVQVPNGVYFYRLRLEVNESTYEQKGAITKIRSGGN